MSATRTTTVGVEGLHCAGCATGLAEALRRLEGVITADVDLEAAQAQVRVDPARLSDDDVRQGITTAGFEPA